MVPQMTCPQCWGSKTYQGQSCSNCLGTGVVADAQLAPNFLLSELLASDTAVRHGVANVPDDQQLQNLTALATDILQPLRDHFGPLHISSGLRCLPLNALVGSKPTSAHPEGNAADLNVIAAGVTRKQVVAWIIANKDVLNYDQVIYEGTWIHVGRQKNGSAGPRKQALMMFGGAYFAYDANDARVH